MNVLETSNTLNEDEDEDVVEIDPTGRFVRVR